MRPLRKSLTMTTIQVCRICLAEHARMYSVTNTKLQDFYEKNTCKPLTTLDGRLSMVCYICYHLLMKCYRFIELAIKSDNLLKKNYERHTKIEKKLFATLYNKSSFARLSQFAVFHISIDSKAPARNKKHSEVKYEKREIKVDYSIDEDEMGRDETVLFEDPMDNDFTGKSETQKNPTAIKKVNDKMIQQETSRSESGYAMPQSCKNRVSTNKSAKTAGPQEQQKRVIHDTNVSTTRTLKSNKCTSDLEAHTKIHTGEEPSSNYDFCGIITSQDQVHIESIHNEKKEMEGIKDSDRLPCNYCGKILKQRNLANHIKRHLGQRNYVCHYCGKKFFTNRNLTVHIRIHTGVKPYLCRYCNRAFRHQCNMQKHERIHTGEKPYACELCGKKTSSVGNLTVHMRSHTGERPFACHFCERTFQMKLRLTEHLRSHTGEKPFACDYCGKAFACKKWLEGHIKMHTGVKPFMCNVCGKKFTRKVNLTLHERLHTGDKPFSCDYCQIRYHDKSYLKKHIISVHNNVGN